MADSEQLSTYRREERNSTDAEDFVKHKLTVAAGLASCAVLLPTAAQAGPLDHTPPTLSQPVAHYIIGQQLSASDYGYEPGEHFYIYDWGVRWRWTASDQSKICSEKLTYKDSAYETSEPEVLIVKASTRSYAGRVSGYDAAKAGSAGYLAVSVKDCAGNTSSSDKTYAPYLDVTEDADSSISYQRSWGTAYFKGFSPGGPEGATHYTSEKGASFVTSVQGGRPVALVMETKSDRGAVAVYVDGKQVATVNTYRSSAAAMHRAIVWEKALAPGTHTLRVVNLATPGRPRVDIDAVMN